MMMLGVVMFTSCEDDDIEPLVAADSGYATATLTVKKTSENEDLIFRVSCPKIGTPCNDNQWDWPGYEERVFEYDIIESKGYRDIMIQTLAPGATDWEAETLRIYANQEYTYE